MNEIKERRKRVLAMLLGLIVFICMPSISSLAADADLGNFYYYTFDKDSCNGMHLKPGDTISWGVGSDGSGANVPYTVKYVVGNTTYDNNNTTPDLCSGNTESYTVLSLQVASGGADLRSVGYWELTSVKKTAGAIDDRGSVEEIILVAHFPDVVKSVEEHKHNYDWVVTKSATEEEDGEEAYMCSCGRVLYTLPLTAAGEFMNEVIREINKAPSGATVEITTNKWLCFNKAVCEAYALRPDVTLKINYREEGYKGTKLTTVVPAGTDLRNYLNEEGYVGFLYLRTLFTTTINQ